MDIEYMFFLVPNSGNSVFPEIKLSNPEFLRSKDLYIMSQNVYTSLNLRISGWFNFNFWYYVLLMIRIFLENN